MFIQEIEDEIERERVGLEEISRRLFRIVDCIGYSQNMIQIRRLEYKTMAAKLTQMTNRRTVVVGSKGEGISKQFESDIDCLCFMTNTICFDGPIKAPALSDMPETIFHMIYTHPGYCILECVRRGSCIDDKTLNSLVPFEGKTVLSSEVFGREQLKGGWWNSHQTGPAMTFVIKNLMSTDHVSTFGFDSQNALHDWQRRDRKYGWPPVPIRKAISEMRGNLVAKGMKGSRTEDLEWRLCFGEIELLIVQALNDTQIKLYILLKIINRDILKNSGHNVSSYMMKNIVFWLAENNPQSMFSPETLLSWIVEALRQLQHYVEVNNLPYYMIPGRNLLTEKIGDTEREPLQRLLTDLIQAGPNILYQCETVAQELLMTPRDLKVLRDKHDQLECLSLLGIIQFPFDGEDVQRAVEVARGNGDPVPAVLNTVTKFLMSRQGQAFLQSLRDLFLSCGTVTTGYVS